MWVSILVMVNLSMQVDFTNVLLSHDLESIVVTLSGDVELVNAMREVV